jgi:hypothetical protein
LSQPTPAAAQAALLQALQAFIGARESLDIAQQMHLQIICDPASIPSQKDLADTKLTEFERAEELALAALIGAYRGWLASMEVSEIVLDGQRIKVLSTADELDLATAADRAKQPLLDPASLKQRFSDFLSGSR